MFASLWETFTKGGLVMYPLLICSIISLAIFIERWLYLNHCSSDGDYNASLNSRLRQKDWAGTKALAAGAQGDCAKMTEVFLEQGNMTHVETEANICLEAYEDNLLFLRVIVTIAPLLGLLGTIAGMIRSFKVFDLRAGQPFAITSGIGEALIATAFGLIVAIIAMLAYGILKYRIALLTRKLALCCSLLETAKAEVKDHEA